MSELMHLPTVFTAFYSAVLSGSIVVGVIAHLAGLIHSIVKWLAAGRGGTARHGPIMRKGGVAGGIRPVAQARLNADGGLGEFSADVPRVIQDALSAAMEKLKVAWDFYVTTVEAHPTVAAITILLLALAAVIF